MQDPFPLYYQKASKKLDKVELILEQRKEVPGSTLNVGECATKLEKVQNIISNLEKVITATRADPSRFNLTESMVNERNANVERLKARWSNAKAELERPVYETNSNIIRQKQNNLNEKRKTIEYHKNQIKEDIKQIDQELINNGLPLAEQIHYQAKLEGELIQERRDAERDIDNNADRMHNRIKKQNQTMKQILEGHEKCIWITGLVILSAFAIFMVIYAITL